MLTVHVAAACVFAGSLARGYARRRRAGFGRQAAFMESFAVAGVVFGFWVLSWAVVEAAAR